MPSAIRSELDSDYRGAVGSYQRLANQGSVLDRVGMFQAIARCYEKLGALPKAGYWHERAGRGFLALPTRVMGTQERAYYAVLEFRSAIQDYKLVPSTRRATKSYLKALGVCLERGKEGYSHEMLFAGLLCAKLKMPQRAAAFFIDCAQQFSRESKNELAVEMYAMAAASHLARGKARK